MLIGINQWRATIDLFWNDKHHSNKKDLNRGKVKHELQVMR